MADNWVLKTRQSPWVLQREIHKTYNSGCPRLLLLCSNPTVGPERTLSDGSSCIIWRLWCFIFSTLELFWVFLMNTAWSYSQVELIQSEDQIPALNNQFLPHFNSQQFWCWASTEVSYRHYRSYSSQNLSPESNCFSHRGPVVFPLNTSFNAPLLAIFLFKMFSKWFPADSIF